MMKFKKEEDIPLDDKDFQSLKRYILQLRPYRDHKTIIITFGEIANKVGFQHFWFDSVYQAEGEIRRTSQLLDRLDELPPKIAMWLRKRNIHDRWIELNPEDLIDPLSTSTPDGASSNTAPAAEPAATAEDPQNAGKGAADPIDSVDQMVT